MNYLKKYARLKDNNKNKKNKNNYILVIKMDDFLIKKYYLSNLVNYSNNIYYDYKYKNIDYKIKWYNNNDNNFEINILIQNDDNIYYKDNIKRINNEYNQLSESLKNVRLSIKELKKKYKDTSFVNNQLKNSDETISLLLKEQQLIDQIKNFEKTKKKDIFIPIKETKICIPFGDSITRKKNNINMLTFLKESTIKPQKSIKYINKYKKCYFNKDNDKLIFY